MPRVLRDAGDAAAAVERIAATARGYNGFNLVAGERATRNVCLEPAQRHRERCRVGISGLSNAGLDTPWPKLVRAKAGVAAWVASGSDDLDALLGVLNDRAVGARRRCCRTPACRRERERLLSSPFIVSDDYGTRCSTVARTIARRRACSLSSAVSTPSGEVTGDVEFRFIVKTTCGAA